MRNSLSLDVVPKPGSIDGLRVTQSCGVSRGRAMSWNDVLSAHPALADCEHAVAEAAELLTLAFNDCDPELTFTQLVLAFGRRGDVLCAISTSGSSPNILRAARVASALGLRVLGITGARGEPLARLSDVAVKVPATHTGRIQELYLPLYRYLSEAVEAALFPVKGNA